MTPELSPALLRWLEQLLASVPPEGRVTVTWSRDRQGRLRGAAEVERRERHSWEDQQEGGRA